MRTPREKRQQCLTTRLTTHRIPQKPLTQTLASSPPHQVRFHQEVRGTASIYANNLGSVNIFYPISERLRPFGPVHSPIRRVRLARPRRTVPDYRIPVFKGPSESTRTSVFALYAQLSGLIGLLWTSPFIQVNCPCCQFIPAQLLFEELPRY